MLSSYLSVLPPMIPSAREVELASVVKAGLDARKRMPTNETVKVIAAGQKARNELISANLRVVIPVAQKFAGCADEVADLIQAGNEGLIKAAELWDPKGGQKFANYATWWIARAIKDTIGRDCVVRVPSYITDHRRAAIDGITEFMKENGREPTEEEIAAMLGFIQPNADERQRRTAILKARHLIRAGADAVSLDAMYEMGRDEAFTDHEYQMVEEEATE
jgi:RNA polymerase sigma factor (sigma-70 family)